MNLIIRLSYLLILLFGPMISYASLFPLAQLESFCPGGHLETCLAHVFDLQDKVKDRTPQLAAIPFEGADERITRRFFAHLFQEQARISPTPLLHTDSFSESAFIAESKGFRTGVDIRATIRKHDYATPLILPLGWKGHNVSIVIYKDTIAYINRGARGLGVTQPLTVYKMPAGVDSKDFALGFLAEYFSKPNHQYRHNIYHSSTHPDAIQTTITATLTNMGSPIDLGTDSLSIPTALQDSGNCTYANAEGSYLFLNLVDKLHGLGVAPGASTDSFSLLAHNLGTVMPVVTREYQQFQQGLRERLMESVIQATQDPSVPMGRKDILWGMLNQIVFQSSYRDMLYRTRQHVRWMALLQAKLPMSGRFSVTQWNHDMAPISPKLATLVIPPAAAVLGAGAVDPTKAPSRSYISADPDMRWRINNGVLEFYIMTQRRWVAAEARVFKLMATSSDPVKMASFGQFMSFQKDVVSFGNKALETLLEDFFQQAFPCK